MKPENIVFVSRDERSEIKITDFGLALLDREVSAVHVEDNLVGTPG
ncbi:unnamed protein product [Discosporangium mesarthrocarpum]